mgnify:FL=1
MKRQQMNVTSNAAFLVHFLLFLTNLCLFFLVEFENNCSNISLVIGKYVTSVNLVSLISCGK